MPKHAKENKGKATGKSLLMSAEKSGTEMQKKKSKAGPGKEIKMEENFEFLSKKSQRDSLMSAGNSVYDSKKRKSDLNPTTEEKKPRDDLISKDKKKKKKKKKHDSVAAESVARIPQDEKNSEDECTKLKDEVANFLSGFNFDTSSDISEPEGLDEIDDD